MSLESSGKKYRRTEQLPKRTDTMNSAVSREDQREHFMRTLSTSIKAERMKSDLRKMTARPNTLGEYEA